MNLKFIYDPIDKLIHQAKDYIQEQEVRRDAFRKIEDKIIEIRPGLESRKQSVEELLSKLEDKAEIRPKMESLKEQIDVYLQNIELIAEKDFVDTNLDEENKEEDNLIKSRKEEYVAREVLRLEEDLEATDNFFEVADFANQIWADFSLFEEFHREEVVVQMLVDRMNKTNTRDTETRIGKDLSKTLEHIRRNLIKTSAWSEQEMLEYKEERDRKFRNIKKINISLDRPCNVSVIGGTSSIVEGLYRNFDIPSQLRLEWIDIFSNDIKTIAGQIQKKDLIVFLSNYREHPLFQDLRNSLNGKVINHVFIGYFNKEKVMQLIEEKVIEITFKKHFS